ncbi:MAG: hypothetical protein RQ753_09670, partial [Desulfurivibrionaceae bacterium]|nr:hypothetical protein [Desulfurivibrionaceae bacterium]
CIPGPSAGAELLPEFPVGGLSGLGREIKGLSILFFTCFFIMGIIVLILKGKYFNDCSFTGKLTSKTAQLSFTR